MKRLLTLLLFVLISLASYSQKRGKLTLSGSLPELAGDKLIITDIAHFKAEIPIANPGIFKTDVDVEPGFYTFQNIGFYAYLEPGMNLSVSIGDKKPVFTGKGSAENNLFVKIQQMQTDYIPLTAGYITADGKIIEVDDFLSRITHYKKAVTDLLAIDTLSKSFVETQKEITEYTCQNLTYQYVLHYGFDLVKRDAATKEMMDYMLSRKPGEPISQEMMMKQLNASLAARTKILSGEDRARLEVFENFDLNNEHMYFSSVVYRNMLDTRLQQIFLAEAALSPSLRSKNKYEKNIYLAAKAITNTRIKENIVYQNTRMLLLTGKDFEKYYQDFLTITKDEIYVSEIRKIYESIKVMMPGAISPGFAFADVRGNTISLSSFKGNYVYIDLWATWCQPCIAEIPSLKILEKDYEGKNIKFVSISTDAPRDLEKWKRFVAENKLGGTQIHAEKDSEFIKFYNVATIPRFILLDPEGKIVFADANRPSNPALRKQLDGLVK